MARVAFEFAEDRGAGEDTGGIQQQHITSSVGQEKLAEIALGFTGKLRLRQAGVAVDRPTGTGQRPVRGDQLRPGRGHAEKTQPSRKIFQPAGRHGPGANFKQQEQRISCARRPEVEEFTQAGAGRGDDKFWIATAGGRLFAGEGAGRRDNNLPVLRRNRGEQSGQTLWP